MSLQLWSEQVGLADAESGPFEEYDYFFSNDRKLKVRRAPTTPVILGALLAADRTYLLAADRTKILLS